MKKFLSGLLTGVILTSIPAAFALTTPEFKDVGETWYKDAVYRMANIGIIKGYENKTFQGNKDITRAEVAVMLDRLTQYIDKTYVKADENENLNNISETDCNQTDLTDWATWSNKIYGYEIKHPSCWKAGETLIGNNTHITYEKTAEITGWQGDGDIIISIEAKTNITEGLQEWFHKNAEFTLDKQKQIVNFMAEENRNNPNSNPIQLSDIITHNENTKVAGLDAIVQYTKFLKPSYIEGGPDTSKEYYFKRNNTLYIISTSTPTASEAENRIATFDKMIRTFKFNN